MVEEPVMNERITLWLPDPMIRGVLEVGFQLAWEHADMRRWDVEAFRPTARTELVFEMSSPWDELFVAWLLFRAIRQAFEVTSPAMEIGFFYWRRS